MAVYGVIGFSVLLSERYELMTSSLSGVRPIINYCDSYVISKLNLQACWPFIGDWSMQIDR